MTRIRPLTIALLLSLLVGTGSAQDIATPRAFRDALAEAIGGTPADCRVETPHPQVFCFTVPGPLEAAIAATDEAVDALPSVTKDYLEDEWNYGLSRRYEGYNAITSFFIPAEVPGYRTLVMVDIDGDETDPEKMVVKVVGSSLIPSD